MANLLEIMRMDADSSNTAYGLFLLDFQKESNTVYNFLEGESDIPYYQLRIEQIADALLVKVYSCNGKHGVLEVYRLINSNLEFKGTRLGFYIDRDFDKTLGNADIYVTPYYSVENLYTDLATLQKVLRSLYKIDELSDDFFTCIALYNKLLGDFHDYVGPINAWISCYIDKKNVDGISKHVNINQLTETLFLNVVANKKEGLNYDHAVSTYEDIQAFFSNYIDVSESAFTLKLASFKDIKRAHFFRGKFELRFLASFLEMLKFKLSKPNNSISQRKYKCLYLFDVKTIMVLLNGFAHTPFCLREYVKKIAA
jgi:hypothetical protein